MQRPQSTVPISLSFSLLLLTVKIARIITCFRNSHFLQSYFNDFYQIASCSMEWHKLLMTFHSSSLREYLGINYWDVQVCKIHILHEWVHLCNKCWTSYPAAKKRLFRGGQDVLWQRGIRASIQKGWKEESHKREIPRSSDRITKKSLYPRVLVIFNRSFTPNLIIIANIFKALLILTGLHIGVKFIYTTQSQYWLSSRDWTTVGSR